MRPTLRQAKKRAATTDQAIQNTNYADVIAAVMGLTGGVGADVAVEAVGVRQAFELAADLIRPGDHITNAGVHGHRAMLHLEKLGISDVTITTGLVDTSSISQLLKLIEGGSLDATDFATHRFALAEMEHAYDVFANAAVTEALKVVLHV